MATMVIAPTFDIPIVEPRSAPTDRILVVSNDSTVQKALQKLLSPEGYEVDLIPDGLAGLEALRQSPPAAVILELRHVREGCDLCRNIVELMPGLPLLILSSSVDVADKVLLLEMGADDYVTLPFSPRELVARLRALMRRAGRASLEMPYVFKDMVVDYTGMDVTRCGEKVHLTAKEFKTLAFMIRHAQRAVSREELLKEVWGYQSYPCTRTVDNHILRLRQKLERDPSEPAHFLTIYGMGYKFVP